MTTKNTKVMKGDKRERMKEKGSNKNNSQLLSEARSILGNSKWILEKYSFFNPRFCLMNTTPMIKQEPLNSAMTWNHQATRIKSIRSLEKQEKLWKKWWRHSTLGTAVIYCMINHESHKNINCRTLRVSFESAGCYHITSSLFWIMAAWAHNVD